MLLIMLSNFIFLFRQVPLMEQGTRLIQIVIIKNDVSIFDISRKG
jgi:hypothetical protein